MFDPIKTIDLLQELSAAPIVGDPFQDQQVDGVAYDDYNVPLFWTVGHAQDACGWMKLTYDENDPPAPHLMKLVFQMLDDEDIQAEFRGSYREENDVWSI